MTKRNVLLVGQHPLVPLGNGNMMFSILNQLDDNKCNVSVFAVGKLDPSETNIFKNYPFRIIEVHSGWGENQLLNTLASQEIDLVIFVGIDIWRYSKIFPHIGNIRAQKDFKIAAIFPYDLQQIRNDWLACVDFVDFPYVYSDYGFRMINPYIEKTKYFRPALKDADLFVPCSLEDKMKKRTKYFPSMPLNGFLIGYVGANQHRKDPQTLIRAVAKLREEHENAYLYLHTDLGAPPDGGGIFNLAQYISDHIDKKGVVFAKKPNPGNYSVEQMIELYQCFDVLVNCSMQEGLSWVPLEAMLSGCPVIVSNSTAHPELIKDAGTLVPCETESYLPLHTKNGLSWVDAKKCESRDIKKSIEAVMKDEELRQRMIKRGLVVAKEWLDGVSNVNSILDDYEEEVKRLHVNKRQDAVLFAQHSSAGDVLMSTQCLKGIKERHPDKNLVYMTQKCYQGIVEENPFIDEVIDWDNAKLLQYEVVYNPHGEKILPGGFNTLDDTLYSMYPYFCNVEASPIEIVPEEIPEFPYEKGEYIIVHTAGQDKRYRTYNHMDLVVSNLKKKIVQIGAVDDAYCTKADLDLRGKLTWRQTAWLMKNAAAGVVVDSFPSHLAGAVGMPCVVLYGPASARVVRPRDDDGVIVNIEPDKKKVCPSLTSCWGRRERGACDNPCINTISPFTVRKALVGMLED